MNGGRTLYLDLNAFVRPDPRVTLFAHAGALQPLGGGRLSGGARLDVRTGVALQVGRAELKLAWSRTARIDYPIGYPQKRSAVVASIAASF